MNDTTVNVLAAAMDAGVPPLLWGPPGIGKSSMIEALAEKLGMHCEVVIASLREPADFAGMPVVRDDGTVALAPPAWARRLEAAGGGLLFLDEVTTAPPAVQAALLRVVIERVVGDLQLPKGVKVIAAANPPEQAAGGYDLAPPLANRFLHLHMGGDADLLAAGLTTGWDSVTPNLRVAEPPTGSRKAAVNSMVARFVQVKRELVLSVPTDEAAASGAWPSHRTWTYLAEVGARIPDSDHGAWLMAATGLVGEAAAVEFLTWRQHLDLPDPRAVLNDPSIVNWSDSRRPDRHFVTLNSVVALAAHEATIGAWNKAWNVLAACAAGAAPDVPTAAALALGKCRPDKGRIPKVATVFIPLLTKAGLLNPAERVAA